MPKKSKTVLSPDGYHIPVRDLDPAIGRREVAVDKAFALVEKAEAALGKAITEAQRVINEYLDTVADGYGEAWKGNAEIKNYAGTRSIQIEQSQFVEFDERLQVAKDILDRCVEGWLSGTQHGDKVIQIIRRAFRTDKKGRLDYKLVLSLKEFNFDSEDWNKAMDIIMESIRRYNGKIYYRFRRRPSAADSWEGVRLSITDY